MMYSRSVKGNQILLFHGNARPHVLLTVVQLFHRTGSLLFPMEREEQVLISTLPDFSLNNSFDILYFYNHLVHILAGKNSPTKLQAKKFLRHFVCPKRHISI